MGYWRLCKKEIQNAWGVNPQKTHLRNYKDGWIKDKKDSIKKPKNTIYRRRCWLELLGRKWAGNQI